MKLLGLSNEFDSCSVGVSCRFFTVTYTFISSVLSGIIYYHFSLLNMGHNYFFKYIFFADGRSPDNVRNDFKPVGNIFELEHALCIVVILKKCSKYFH